MEVSMARRRKGKRERDNLLTCGILVEITVQYLQHLQHRILFLRYGNQYAARATAYSGAYQ